LRILGPAILLAGLVLTLVGVGSFFSSFGTFESPRYFWCAFLGIPLVGIGGMITKVAFLGTITRYFAGEVAPVQKDVFNYMVAGTKDSIRDAATAVGEGLGIRAEERGEAASRCRQCGTENEAEANFCKSCGAPLAQTRTCPACGDANAPDARFCDHCGREMAQSP
jgi:hypothetical protein